MSEDEEESLIELAARLPFWQDLTEPERRLVKDTSVVRHYSRGSLLMGNNDSAKTCFGMIFVLSGEIRAYMESYEGREITLFHIRSGECCILSASCVIAQLQFDTQLIVSDEADLLVVPSSVFGSLTEKNLRVRCFMYEKITERFSLVMAVMQQLLFERFDRRLASFLIDECRRTGQGTVRMTQEQIAECVNSAREVVSRMLKRFAEEGLIEYKRGVITVKDMTGLTAIAQEQ